MDDNNDYGVIYVDTRNATNDHRTGGGRPVPFMPGGNRIPPGWGLGTRVTQPVPYQQPQVVYATAPTSNFGAALFSKITPGQVVDMVAQLFAALQPLPTAPAVTKDANTDAANNILFQSALASHAKLDERVRTFGGLLAKLVG